MRGAQLLPVAVAGAAGKGRMQQLGHQRLALQRVAPLAVGNSEIAVGGRLREATVVGTSTDFLELRGLRIGQGSFLPREDFNRASAVAVIGDTLRGELFPGQGAVGRMIRVGDTRLRVIGVLAPSGRGLGMTTDELVLVPVATAQAMFDTSGLFRIFVEARGREALPGAQRQVEERLRARRARNAQAGVRSGACPVRRGCLGPIDTVVCPNYVHRRSTASEQPDWSRFADCRRSL